MKKKIPAFIFFTILAGLAAFVVTRKPSRPSYPRWETFPKPQTAEKPSASTDPDAALVRSLLGEKLSTRTFSFATVAEACSGKKVIPLDQSKPHQQVIAAIESAMAATLADLNRPDSPVRALRRINEASRFFEDGLLQRLNSTPGLTCDLPRTRAGDTQRSGYPDLRVTHTATNTIFYLDPKLVEQGSEKSTFRTFYFEPKNETLKITDNATHLLLGIEHDGKDGAWTFLGWRLVDLSTLRVRLKAEFQASNAELYRETKLSLPPPSP
jgi:hypothetical protein